ncbi:MAG TPA: Uma2 family endonuclease [Candidatus Sulfotelmatobacter sp.]|nr:Uma2 family endonuclease [Candidatus Sulfotelmatobacter sp.]
MQTTIAEQEPHPRPFTVAEYYRLGDVGIIKPEERVELLNGLLRTMPPIGPKHAYALRRLDALLQDRVGSCAVVSVQLPFRLGEFSELQPDLVLLRLPAERYRRVHPTPADALLVVEVAVTSVRYDRGPKLEAYASGGVREYWIVDVAHRRVELYLDPAANGFRVARVARGGDAIAPEAFPDLVLTVDELLLPPA